MFPTKHKTEAAAQAHKKALRDHADPSSTLSVDPIIGPDGAVIYYLVKEYDEMGEYVGTF